MILHIYKNAFISIEKKTEIARSLIASNQYELVDKHLTDINFLADDSVLRIERMLDNLRRPTLHYETVNLRACIMSALAKINIPQNIKVDYSKIKTDTTIYASMEQMTEVFINLLLNSLEAINQQKRKFGYIDINVIDEGDAIAINFQDNGCGIPKNNYRNIFKPFFSTKNVASSGGIGLSYVERIVKDHHGEVYVKSIVEVYTLFQVVLPALNKEK